jgi:uncharacterized protein Smg (DUF494 family)
MSDTLTTLLTELRERFAPGADVREVEIYLASRGYDARQIGEILARLADHLDAVGEDPATSAPRRLEGPVFRVMGTHERSRFSADAWGHLIALGATGALSPMDREHLIERALLQTDGRVGLAELRALESAGFDEGGAAGATTIH